MKHLKTISLLTFGLILLASQPVMAQNAPTQHQEKSQRGEHPRGPHKGARMNPQKFKADFNAFITRKLSLPKADAEQLLSAYHEMRQKQHNNNSLMFRMLKNQRESQANEKDAQKVLNEVIKLRQQNADLETAFYKRMSKQISAKTLLDFQTAERHFFMHSFNKGEKK